MCAAGILVIVAAYAYVALFLARPIGHGPAGPAVAREPFEQIWSERDVLLLGIGDSITAGLGANSPQHSYFARLLDNPSDEFPGMQGICLRSVLPNVSSQNIAVSGTTSLQHAALINERLEAFDEQTFALVVMTTGGNDIIHNYGRSPPREGAMYGATFEQATPWIANFEQRLRDMLGAVEALFPGGHEVYLGDIYDPTDGVGDAPSIFLPDWPDGLRIHAAYNAAIAKVAGEKANVHVVPLFETFLGHGAHCRQFWRPHFDPADAHYWFYENVEDPNDRGYDAIRRTFLQSIVANSSISPASER